MKTTNVANSMLGLSLVLYPNTRQYGSVVMNGFKGFKGLIHSAKDFPEVGGKGFAIGSGKEVFVGIGAQYTTASEEVENMSFERRKCLKQGEEWSTIEELDGLIIESYSYYDQKVFDENNKPIIVNLSSDLEVEVIAAFDLDKFDNKAK